MIVDILIIIGIPMILVVLVWFTTCCIRWSMEKEYWKETHPKSPIISFEKFKTLYELDKSRWILNENYVVFMDNNNHCTSLGMTYRDYLKYKKYYKYLNKKHATADAELKQKNFEDTLDKYLESKISKIQNDLQKNTEELKQRTENYKSDFDCINAEIKKVLQYHNIENAWIEDSEWGKAIHVPENISEYACKHLNKKGYIVVLEKEKIK